MINMHTKLEVSSLSRSRDIFVRSFVIAGRGPSSLLWTPALRPLCRSNAPAQGEEGIGRCVRCMCELCRVEEGLSRREQLVRYF